MVRKHDELYLLLFYPSLHCLSSPLSLVECKAVFSDNSFSSDSVIKLSIYFRSSAPIDLTLSKVQVLMDNQV